MPNIRSLIIRLAIFCGWTALVWIIASLALVEEPWLSGAVAATAGIVLGAFLAAKG